MRIPRAALAATVLTGMLGLGLAGGPAIAKDTVKVGFIGPLTGGTSAIGLGGRNSADLAVQAKERRREGQVRVRARRARRRVQA